MKNANLGTILKRDWGPFLKRDIANARMGVIVGVNIS